VLLTYYKEKGVRGVRESILTFCKGKRQKEENGPSGVT